MTRKAAITLKPVSAYSVHMLKSSGQKLSLNLPVYHLAFFFFLQHRKIAKSYAITGGMITVLRVV